MKAMVTIFINMSFILFIILEDRQNKLYSSFIDPWPSYYPLKYQVLYMV